MTLLLDPQQRSTRPAWHVFFFHTLRYVPAPLLFVSSGFFHGEFHCERPLHLAPHQPRVCLDPDAADSRLRVHLQGSHHSVEHPDRAFNAVLYSCMIPYALGVLMMLALAKL